LEETGQRPVSEFKELILDTMISVEECHPGRCGLTYREIENLAGLNRDLSDQRAWITLSVLQSLREEKLIDAEKRGRYLYWTLSNEAN
jgi:hypothetical protein